PLLRHVAVRAEERILVDRVPVPAAAVDLVRPHLHEGGAHAHAGHDLARDGAGGDAHGGLARRGAAAAAIVADAVLRLIGEIGVAGAVALADIGIILRARVDILDHQADRRARRHEAAARL